MAVPFELLWVDVLRLPVDFVGGLDGLPHLPLGRLRIRSLLPKKVVPIVLKKTNNVLCTARGGGARLLPLGEKGGGGCCWPIRIKAARDSQGRGLWLLEI